MFDDSRCLIKRLSGSGPKKLPPNLGLLLIRAGRAGASKLPAALALSYVPGKLVPCSDEGDQMLSWDIKKNGLVFNGSILGAPETLVRPSALKEVQRKCSYFCEKTVNKQ